MLFYKTRSFWRRAELLQTARRAVWRRSAVALASLPDVEREKRFAGLRLERAVEEAAVAFEEQALRRESDLRRRACLEAYEAKRRKAVLAHEQGLLGAPVEDVCGVLDSERGLELGAIEEELNLQLAQHIAPVRESLGMPSFLLEVNPDLRERLAKAERPLHVLVQDYVAECPKQVEALHRGLHLIGRWVAIAVAALRRKISEDFARAHGATARILEDRVLRRGAAAARVRLRGALPACPEGASLSLPLQRTLDWLGCPVGCALAALSRATVCEAVQRRPHGRVCPAVRRCAVCGFAVWPGPLQAASLAAHRRRCAPWHVDGQMFRHFLAARGGLPAGFASQAILQAVETVEASDAPGTDRSGLGPEAVVCCPHFGCAEGFAGRAAALQHAAGCPGRGRPPYVEGLAEGLAGLGWGGDGCSGGTGGFQR